MKNLFEGDNLSKSIYDFIVNYGVLFGVISHEFDLEDILKPFSF